MIAKLDRTVNIHHCWHATNQFRLSGSVAFENERTIVDNVERLIIGQ
jgi:hypothetical protein